MTMDKPNLLRLVLGEAAENARVQSLQVEVCFSHKWKFKCKQVGAGIPAIETSETQVSGIFLLF